MDPALYVWCKDGTCVFLLDRVDDILQSSSDPTLTWLVKDRLSFRHEMSHVEVEQEYFGLSLSKNTK